MLSLPPTTAAKATHALLPLPPTTAAHAAKVRFEAPPTITLPAALDTQFALPPPINDLLELAMQLDAPPKSIESAALVS